ncbi:hypothetical protein LINPERHAP2_LOCUS34046 [Linum perenne]
MKQRRRPNGLERRRSEADDGPFLSTDGVCSGLDRRRRIRRRRVDLGPATATATWTRRWRRRRQRDEAMAATTRWSGGGDETAAGTNGDGGLSGGARRLTDERLPAAVSSGEV